MMYSDVMENIVCPFLHDHLCKVQETCSEKQLPVI